MTICKSSTRAVELFLFYRIAIYYVYDNLYFY